MVYKYLLVSLEYGGGGCNCTIDWKLKPVESIISNGLFKLNLKSLPSKLERF